MSAPNIPDEAATGLDLFAAAWIERFTGLGGNIVAHGADELMIAFPMPGVGRRPKAPNEQTEWHDHGRFRELWDLLEAVPGGREAVRAHVILWPSHACNGQAVAN